VSRYRSKTLATWLAVFGGALGLQRLYLFGRHDAWAWLHPAPSLLGLWGVWRMRTLGQDDQLAWLLIPLLGMMLSIGMVSAIVIGLTPDARWDERHNRGHSPRSTGWGPVLGAIVALMLGGGVLMGTIAFAGQRFFEWQSTRSVAVDPARVRTASDRPSRRPPPRRPTRES
jgi:hypothetical protein